MFVILLAGIFTIVFSTRFWPPFAQEAPLLDRFGALAAPLARSFNALTVAACFAALVALFSTLYLQLAHDVPRCFAAPLRHHLDALYVSITTFTTVGSGGIYPKATACRLAVASQTIVGLMIIAVGIAGLAARLVVQHGRTAS